MPKSDEKRSGDEIWTQPKGLLWFLTDLNKEGREAQRNKGML